MPPSKGAIIYIGSNNIYLKLAEKRKNKLKILEENTYPLNLGQDTFTTNKIGYEKVNKLCEVLNNFLRLIGDYQIKKIKTIATTAIREADNRDYILDQIEIKTGLKINVLDDTKEKAYIYQDIYRRIKNNSKFTSEKALISYIGTGRLGMAVYYQDKLQSSQNIRIGSLKLSEILGEIQEKTDKFYVVVEEYLSSFSFMLETFLPTKQIKQFITSGKEIELISKLCQAENKEGISYISKTNFKKLYQQIKDKTPKQIINIYNLQEEKAEVLLPSMALYKTLFDFTAAQQIIVPFASLMDILLFKDLFPKKMQKINQVFTASTISAARNLGQKYNYDHQHAAQVEKFAVKLFDKLTSIHGLESRERLLLQVAAILHDIGKFISLKRHYYHSYDLVRASNILGLSNRETEIVAGITRYHSRKVPHEDSIRYQKLSRDDLILMAKLAAILRLAEALDRGHKQKFSDINIKVTAETMIVEVTTNELTLLEEWNFKQKSSLFSEVFGLKTALNKKGV